MDPTNIPIVSAILAEEGWPKYTNAPGDRGGPTKGGITLSLLRSLRPGATVADLQALTEEDAREIYATEFIARPGFDGIVDGLLRWQMVDCGVPSGPGRATKWLQEAAGVKVDGQLGPATLAAVNAANPHELGIKLAVVRIRFFAAIVEAHPLQAQWINGWMARATRFLEREAGRQS